MGREEVLMRPESHFSDRSDFNMKPVKGEFYDSSHFNASIA